MSKFFLSIIVFLLSSQLFSQTINLDTLFENSSKKVIVYLHKTGCPYCERLEEFTLDDDDVANYIKNNYKFASINVSFDKDVVLFKNKKYTPKHFAQMTGYNFYPSVLFLNHDKKLIFSSVGYKEEREFLAILQYIKLELYKRMSLEQYKKKIDFKAEEE